MRTQLGMDRTRAVARRITRNIADEMPYRQLPYAWKKGLRQSGKMRSLSGSGRKDLLDDVQETPFRISA